MVLRSFACFGGRERGNNRRLMQQVSQIRLCILSDVHSEYVCKCVALYMKCFVKLQNWLLKYKKTTCKIRVKEILHSSCFNNSIFSTITPMNIAHDVSHTSSTTLLLTLFFVFSRDPPLEWLGSTTQVPRLSQRNLQDAQGAPVVQHCPAGQGACSPRRPRGHPEYCGSLCSKEGSPLW